MHSSSRKQMLERSSFNADEKSFIYICFSMSFSYHMFYTLRKKKEKKSYICETNDSGNKII